jgi:hypothetical protein
MGRFYEYELKGNHKEKAIRGGKHKADLHEDKLELPNLLDGETQSSGDTGGAAASAGAASAGAAGDAGEGAAGGDEESQNAWQDAQLTMDQAGVEGQVPEVADSTQDNVQAAEPAAGDKKSEESQNATLEDVMAKQNEKPLARGETAEMRAQSDAIRAMKEATGLFAPPGSARPKEGTGLFAPPSSARPNALRTTKSTSHQPVLIFGLSSQEILVASMALFIAGAVPPSPPHLALVVCAVEDTGDAVCAHALHT